MRYKCNRFPIVVNFCSRVAPRPNFEASHVILVCNFGSKNFKDAQLLMVDFNSSNLRSRILLSLKMFLLKLIHKVLLFYPINLE